MSNYANMHTEIEGKGLSPKMAAKLACSETAIRLFLSSLLILRSFSLTRLIF